MTSFSSESKHPPLFLEDFFNNKEYRKVKDLFKNKEWSSRVTTLEKALPDDIFLFNSEYLKNKNIEIDLLRQKGEIFSSSLRIVNVEQILYIENIEVFYLLLKLENGRFDRIRCDDHLLVKKYLFASEDEE